MNKLHALTDIVKAYATWPSQHVPEAWVSKGDSLCRATGVGIYAPGFIGLYEGLVYDVALYGIRWMFGGEKALGPEYLALPAAVAVVRMAQGVAAALKAREHGYSR